MPPTLTDASLVQRIAAQRDRAAFAELFRRYAPRIAGLYDRQRLEAGVRDELVQEVMLRVWRHAARYRSDQASVTTWIFTIARNARIDHLRRHRPAVDPLDPAFVDDTTPRADTVAAGRQQAAQLRSAIEALPEEQGRILRGAYFDHKTLRELAEEGGVPLGTVKSRVRLALGGLRRILGRGV